MLRQFTFPLDVRQILFMRPGCLLRKIWIRWQLRAACLKLRSRLVVGGEKMVERVKDERSDVLES